MDALRIKKTYVDRVNIAFEDLGSDGSKWSTCRETDAFKIRID